jgi:hypothetical protein
MWFWIFCILAVGAFIGFFYSAMTGKATRMAYSLVMLIVWLGLASYMGGYIG